MAAFYDEGLDKYGPTSVIIRELREADLTAEHKDHREGGRMAMILFFLEGWTVFVQPLMAKSADMIIKDQYRYAERYQIQLNFLREQRNVHQGEAPDGAPFRVIGPRSPVSWRREVEKLARYFKREMGYDFPPYTAGEAEGNRENDPDRVLVFAKFDWEDTIYFIGAIGARWSEWDDAPPCWTLTWAWMHPYERRKGHLTRAWPYVLSMFPDPHMEPPISPSMEQFLGKVDYFSRFVDCEI